MRASLPSLVLLALVALPWARAVADDAPPAPPPAPKDEAPAGRWTEAHPVGPDLKRVGSKVESPFLARWVRASDAYWAKVPAKAAWFAPGAPGVWLRADGPPAPPVPAPSPASAEAAPLPRGIVPIGDLPARIAAARGQEAVELQAALDALNREQEATDARSRILWIGAGETLRGERVTVDEQALPPGKYAVVRSELGARTLRATGVVVSGLAGSRVAVTPSGARYETTDESGARTIRFVVDPAVGGTWLDGNPIKIHSYVSSLPGSPGQPFTVTRQADGTNTITFPAAPGPTRTASPSGGPGLSTAIGELRAEIRALREEIRALRAALEGTSGPK